MHILIIIITFITVTNKLILQLDSESSNLTKVSYLLAFVDKCSSSFIFTACLNSAISTIYNCQSYNIKCAECHWIHRLSDINTEEKNHRQSPSNHISSPIFSSLSLTFYLAQILKSKNNFYYRTMVEQDFSKNKS